MISVTTELTQALYGAEYRAVRDRYRGLFSDPIFQRPEQSLPDEQCRLAYRRLRFINDRLDRPADVVRRVTESLAVYEWCALVDPTLAAIAILHYDLCLGPVLDNDSPCGGLVDELLSLSSVGVFLATEVGHGRSDFPRMETEATYQPSTNEFVLHTPTPQARKFMTNTGLPGVAKTGVVLARTKAGDQDYGIHPFVVRLRDTNGPLPGVRITRLPEQRGLALDGALTSFEHLRVPADHLLAGTRAVDELFRTRPIDPRNRLMRSMARAPRAQLGVVCLVLTWARASVAIAVDYSCRRIVPGAQPEPVPLVDVPNQLNALIGALAQVYALTCWSDSLRSELAIKCDEGTPRLALETTLAKAVCSEAAFSVITMCRQRCGARGLLAPNLIADYAWACDSAITALGDNQSTLASAAAQLIATYAPNWSQTFKNDSPDGEQILYPLLLAEQRLHTYLTAATPDPVTADDGSEPNAFARIYAARRATESLLLARRRITSKETRTVLLMLATRYALNEISTNTTLLLTSHLFNTDEIRTTLHGLAHLNKNLRPYTRSLTNAFDIPPELLANPMKDDEIFGGSWSWSDTPGPSGIGACSGLCTG